jgi:hypothetical protein
MAVVKNFKFRFLLLFMFILLNIQSQHVQASPWAVPGNLILRHDIQVLVDSGVINIPITTWPLAWGDIAYNLSKTEQEMTSFELASFQRIKEALLEEEIGGISANTSLKFAKNPETITSFNDSVGASREIEGESTYLGKNVAINLHVKKQGGETLFDESYIAVALGDYSISLGSKKNWWGPGWGGSLILSTNANPISGISIERNFSDPFESKLLHWIGPWDLSLLLGELEHSRTRSDALFFGMRIGSRPLTNLEIGFSKTSLFCGENRSCGFSSFSDMLLDKTDSGYNLSGFDFRSSHHIKNFPFVLYGQIIGEGISDNHLGLFGLETWGPINDFDQLESYRVFLEAASTSCEFYNNDDSKYGCAYHDSLYPDGYRYEGVNIGHSADGDALVLTLGGIIVAQNSQLIKSSLSLGKLNRGSNYLYKVSQNNNDFFKFDLGYEFDLFWFDIPLGNFDVGLGLDIMKDKVNNTTQKDPRIYVSYSNSLDFNPKKVRDYSEYLALIEVSEDEGIDAEETSETVIQAIDFVIIGELDLSELISLIDQVALERNPYSEIKNNAGSTKTKGLRKQSMDNDLNFGMLLAGGGYDLTEIMLQLDQTIDKRN